MPELMHLAGLWMRMGLPGTDRAELGPDGPSRISTMSLLGANRAIPRYRQRHETAAVSSNRGDPSDWFAGLSHTSRYRTRICIRSQPRLVGSPKRISAGRSLSQRLVAYVVQPSDALTWDARSSACPKDHVHNPSERAPGHRQIR